MNRRDGHVVTCSIWLSTLLLCTLVLSNPVFGEDTIQLGTVTVNAEPIPGSGLQLRSDDLLGAADLGNELTGSPGIDLVRRGLVGRDPVVRGFQRDDLGVVFNGSQLHGACPNRMDPPLFHYDVFQAGEVVVTKGPYDLSQPGVMGGMIYVRPAPIRPGTHLSSTLFYGSYDQALASLRASASRGLWGVEAGGSHRRSLVPEDGHGHPITAIYPAQSPNRYQQDNLRSRAYEIQMGWSALSFDNGQGLQGRLDLSFQEGQHLLYPYLLMDGQEDRTAQAVLWGRMERDSGLIAALEWKGYWNRVVHTMNDALRVSSLPARPMGRRYSMETQAQAGTSGAGLKAEMDLMEWNAVSGFDLQERTWDADNRLAVYGYEAQAMIPHVVTKLYGLFLQGDRPVGDHAQLAAGIRGDLVHVEAEGLDRERLFGLYLPYHQGKSIHSSSDFRYLSGFIRIEKRFRWIRAYMGGASSSRAPDPEELFIGLMKPKGSNWVGNPDLSPPRNNELDLGIDMVNGGVEWHLSGYYSRVHNYIRVTRADDPDQGGPLLPATTYRNTDAALWGGEVRGSLRWATGLSLEGWASYTAGRDLDREVPLAEIPPLTGGIKLHYGLDSWRLTATLLMAAPQKRVDKELQEEETAGWATADLSVRYRVRKARFEGGVKNLLDKYYFRHLSYLRSPFRSGEKVPEPGRTFYLWLKLEF